MAKLRGKKEIIEWISDQVKISNNLITALDNPSLFADLTIIFPQGEREIITHRCVLAAASPIFAEWLQGGVKQIHISEFTRTEFLHALRAIYSGKNLLTLLETYSSLRIY